MRNLDEINKRISIHKRNPINFIRNQIKENTNKQTNKQTNKNTNKKINKLN